MPLVAPRVQDGQPGVSRGIEPSRRDSRQAIGGGLATVLLVDVEQFCDGRLEMCGRRVRLPRAGSLTKAAGK